MKLIIIFSLLIIGVLLGCAASKPNVAESKDSGTSQKVSQPRQIYGYFSATNLMQPKADSDCMPEDKRQMLGLEFSNKNWVGIEKAVLCYWNELHLQQQYPSHLLVKISDSVLPTGSAISSSCTLVPSHKFNSAKWVERWPQEKSKPQTQQLEIASLKYSDRLAIFDHYKDGFGILQPTYPLPHGWLGIGHIGQAQQYYFSPKAEVQLPGSGNNQQQSPVYGDTENISVFFDYVLNGTCFPSQ
ncbi:MAG: hypothetical protein CL768_03030 [Chloroflexi bacterium]|nr:hypothetical protein [Chloroflexota bacterium]